MAVMGVTLCAGDHKRSDASDTFSKTKVPLFSIEFSARLTRGAVPSTPSIAVRPFEIYGAAPQVLTLAAGGSTY